MARRVLYVLIILLLLCSCNSSLQESDSENAFSELYAVSKEIPISTEGSYLKVIFSGDNVVFMCSAQYGEMGQSKEEYMFSDDMIWITKSHLRYQEPFYIDPQNIVLSDYTVENYVIHNDELFNNTLDLFTKMPDSDKELILDRIDYLLELYES